MCFFVLITRKFGRCWLNLLHSYFCGIFRNFCILEANNNTAEFAQPATRQLINRLLFYVLHIHIFSGNFDISIPSLAYSPQAQPKMTIFTIAMLIILVQCTCALNVISLATPYYFSRLPRNSLAG